MMCTGTVPDSTAPPVLQPSLPKTRGPDITGCPLAMSSSAPTAEHDATLLLAALEEIEVRRAAIEWLLDANLLCLCLV
jgi:hypothetical protein